MGAGLLSHQCAVLGLPPHSEKTGREAPFPEEPGKGHRKELALS